MAIDLYQSRRTHFNRCVYYTCDSDADLETLVLNRQPTGVFYAMEYSAERDSANTVAGVSRFNQNTVTIKTDDDVNDLKQDDLVIFKNLKWRVVDVQFTIKIEKSEFSRENNVGMTIISLRR